MAETTLQSNLVPLKISTDGGTTKKSIVCKKGFTFNHETPITEENTDCGVLIGLGSNKWSFDVEGVVNTTPTSGSEVSYEDLLGIANAQTQIDVYLDHPSGSGTDVYASGDAYITNLRFTNQVGSLHTFTATITGTGTLDITP
jgi:hypothetical protein